MGLLKRVAANVFSSWMNLAVNLVISFFLAPFVVKSLGNTYYGIWVILMQFTGYLYLLDFGVRESIIRYVSKFNASRETDELGEVLNAGLVFYAGIGAISFLVAAGLALAFPYVFAVDDSALATTRIVVVMAGLTIAQALTFNVYTGVMMGLQRYDLFNAIGVCHAFVRLALILWFLSKGYGIVALAGIQLAMGLANSVLVYWYSKRLLAGEGFEWRYEHLPIKSRLPVFRSLYNYSIHVLVNNLGQKAIYYADVIVIGIFLGPVQVTFFAIAGNLIEYLRRLMLISNNVLNPLVSDLETRNDSDSIRTVVTTGTRLSVLLAFPIAAIYLILGRQFIGNWMGAEYAVVSGDVLAILSLGAALSTPQSTISSALYGISRHSIIARLRIVEALANVALSLALVGTMGIIGVALGTVLPQIAIMTIVLPALSLPVIGISWKEYLHTAYFMPALATLPFAAGCFIVGRYVPADSLFVLLAQIVLLGPIYLAGAWFLGIKAEERTLLLWHLSKLRGEKEIGT